MRLEQANYIELQKEAGECARKIEYHQHRTNKHNRRTGATNDTSKGPDEPTQRGRTGGPQWQGRVAAAKGNAELSKSPRDERDPGQDRPKCAHVSITRLMLGEVFIVIATCQSWKNQESPATGSIQRFMYILILFVSTVIQHISC
jgi:hypothetical protein